MSVDALKKFLDDAAAYPDTTPIKIGDTEVPLSSLRALNASERTQLSEKLAAADKRDKDLTSKQAQVLDLAKKAQEAYEAAETARKTATTPTRTAENPFDDPWLAPVKTALETRDKKIEELTGQLKTVLTTVGNAASIWAEDRWDREYSALDFGKRDKKPTRDELLEFAKNNNLTDRHKMPSLRAAWDKMSEADRQKDIAETARQEGIEEGKRLAMAARVPPPGVAGPGVSSAGKPNKPQSGELGDLYSEAIADPELRALIEQLPAGVI